MLEQQVSNVLPVAGRGNTVGMNVIGNLVFSRGLFVTSFDRSVLGKG